MRRVGVLLALVLLAGCGVARGTTEGSGSEGRLYVGSAALQPEANEDPLFWDYRLRDVVSLADHVVVVTVGRSRPVTVRASEEDGGDMTFTRRTLHVARVLWSRDGAAPAPRTIRADDLYRRTLDGTYVVPIVRTRGWDVLTGTSYLTTSPTPPAVPASVGPEDQWREGVAGSSLEGLARRLTATRSWPGVTPEQSWRERRDAAIRHFG